MATFNAFSLLDDDNNDDPQALAARANANAKAQEVASAAAAKEAAAAAKTFPPVRPQSAKPQSGRGGGRTNRGGRRDGGDAGGRREGGGNSGVRRDGGEGGEDNGFETPSSPFRGGRGEGRERDRGRGRGRRDGEVRRDGGEGGEGRRPRREFDRHSGTGRGTEVSRGGRGRGNWGTPETAAENPEELPKEDGADPTDTKVEEAEGEAEAPVEPEEPEVKQLSLEEYEKQMLEKKKAMGWVADEAAPAKEVDLAQFNGMKVAAKVDAEDELAGFALSESKKKIKSTKAAKPLKEKAVVSDLGFKIAEENKSYDREERSGGRGGRGRGGSDRGRGRGEGRGRGGSDRPPRNAGGPERAPYAGAGGRTGPAPNVMDAAAFPTLG